MSNDPGSGGPIRTDVGRLMRPVLVPLQSTPLVAPGRIELPYLAYETSVLAIELQSMAAGPGFHTWTTGTGAGDEVRTHDLLVGNETFFH